MFKWLHRYFTTRRHVAYGVQVQVDLELVEYPRGIFKLVLKVPEDVSFYIRPRDKSKVRWLHCDECNDSHGFIMGDVRYDEMYSSFSAPSKERLATALDRMEISVL